MSNQEPSLESRENLTQERLESEKHQQQVLETIPKETNELAREIVTQDRLEEEYHQQVALHRSLEQWESGNLIIGILTYIGIRNAILWA